MFARAYFPGRTGQLLIVPREGDFITRPDPNVAYMHSSPSTYDVSIPLMFALRVTLGEMDRNLARMLNALGGKVGSNYLLAVTADHGMPPEPSSPDRRHLEPAIIDLLHEKFDPEAKQLITSFEPENGQIFVDEDRLSHLGLTLRDLVHFLESQPFLFAVFTNDDVRRAANAVQPATPTRRHSK